MKQVTGEDLKKMEIELHKDLAEKYYSIRERNPHYTYFNNKWIGVMRSLIPSGSYKKALDLGCGTVEFYELVTEEVGAEYTGMDLSPHMLEVGMKKYKKINLIEGDAENIPFKDNTFDLVVCRGLIHHLPDPLKGCQEAYRVLKPNGIFIVSEPHSNTILYLVRKMYYKVSSHFSDSHKSFRREEFLTLLKDADFEITGVKYWGILSFPFAFPDIIPSYKFMPYILFILLVQIDLILTKIPFINSLSWHIIVANRKKE